MDPKIKMYQKCLRSDDVCLDDNMDELASEKRDITLRLR